METSVIHGIELEDQIKIGPTSLENVGEKFRMIKCVQTYFIKSFIIRIMFSCSNIKD